MTESRCHYCLHPRPCRPSPTGRPTCDDCWPALRCYDHLGYCRCAGCQAASDAPVEHEAAPGVLGLARTGDDRCDVCESA